MDKKPTISREARIACIVVTNVVIIFAIAVLMEGALWLFYSNPPKGPRGILRGLRHYYTNHGRKVIQWQAEFTRYDHDLSYTLRPGRSVFSNIEYGVAFDVNSLGVRDDEDSLQAPDIVVVGDSHAMGWGVEQDETFSGLVEQRTGLRVLNTAVSSYGTAREMKMLQQVDISNLKFLIIQYCQNDYDENKTLFENKNVLPIMGEKEFQNVLATQQKMADYYFGKYIQYLLPSLIRHQIKELLRPYFFEEEEPVEHEDESDLFLNALIQCGIYFKDVNIIVFEINSYANNDSVFASSLRKKVRTGNFPPEIRRIITIDFSSTLNADHYFLLDDHMKPEGHKVVAEKLVNIIENYQ